MIRLRSARVVVVFALLLGSALAAAPAAAQLDFYTVTPCRVYDSGGSPSLDQGVTYDIPVAGTCGVPANAVAVSLNVTIFGASGDGELVVFATGTTPPTVGALAFKAGKTQGMFSQVALGTDGKVSAHATMTPPSPGKYRLLIDVTGYYESPPMVVSTTPANNASGVALNSNIVINFNETVNVTGSAFELECPSGSPIAFTVTPAPPGATDSFTLDPTTDLPVGVTCTVTVVATEVTDTDGDDPPDAMDADHVFSFSTVDNAPSVVNTTPANGATGVSPLTDITIEFSESVTVSTSSFTLECPVGNAIGFALTPAPPGTIFTLDPSSTLPDEVECTVTVIANQVSDTDLVDPPDNMLADYTFTFTPDAAPPVVTTTGGTTAFTEDGPAVVVDSGVTVTDADSANLASATVTITNPQDGANEVLAATNCPGLTLTPGLNSLSITDSQPLAVYEACLQSVTYNNSSQNPTTSPDRIVRFVVNDGISNSAPADKTVTVAASNDAPSVTTTIGTTVFTEDGGAVVVDAGVTVADVDDTNLESASVSLASAPDGAAETLGVNSPGTNCPGLTVTPGNPLTITGSALEATYQTCLQAVTYNNTDPDPDTSNRTVNFVVNDGDVNSAPAAKTVSITAQPDAPVVTTTAGTTAFTEDGGPVVVDAGVTVSDADDTNLESATVSLASAPDGAAETLAVNSPGTNCPGLTVTPGNPLTITGSALEATYQTCLQAVTYNNTDHDPDTSNRTVNFVVNDGDVNSNTASKTVSVTAQPDAPVVTTTVGTTAFTEDGGAVVVDAGVTVTDADDTNLESATVSLASAPDGAAETLAVNSPGTNCPGLLVTPGNPLTITGSALEATYQTCLRAVTYNNTSQNPTTTNRTVNFVVNDGDSNSNTAPKTVSVAALNDPPDANPDGADITEEAPNVAAANTVSGNVLTNDTDPDSSLTVSAVNGSGASVGNPVAGTYGSVTINSNGSFTYTLDDTNPAVNALAPSQTLNDAFNYTASDGSLTDSATLTVTINGADDPPTPDDEAYDFIGNTQLLVQNDDVAGVPHVFVDGNDGTGRENVLVGDIDPDGGPAISIFGIVGCPADTTAPFDCVLAGQGTVSLQADGSFSFVPVAGDTDATASFQYTLTGNPLIPGTVTLNRFERVWYVDPNAGGGGNGTSALPFNSLDSLDGGSDSDVAGDYIFVHDGTLALSGPMPMEANQRLIGEGHVAVTTPSNFALSIPVDLNDNGSPTNLVLTGTRPQLTNAGGNTVTVTTEIPIEIVGLSLAGGTTAGGGACGSPTFACNAIDLTSAAGLTGSSTLTISNNELRGAGAEGIDVNLNASTTTPPGGFNLNLTNNSWNTGGTHTGNAVDINRVAGTLNLNFSDNTNIVSANAAGAAVNINGGAAASAMITGFANNTVHQNAQGAGIAVSNVTFDASSTVGVQPVSGGSTLIGQSGDVVSGAGLSLSNVTGALAFTDLDIFSGGIALSATGASGFDLDVLSGAGQFESTGNAALSLATLDADIQNALLTSTTSTSGVSLTTVSGTISTTSNSLITKSSGGGTAFSVATSSATVTYAGALNVTAGAGVSLTSNTGSMSFSGGMTLSTGANTGFNATGGGTVTVTDPVGPGNNTITTTTGTALNVSGTTIGIGDLTFERISAGTSGSPANGIVLNGTGSSGELIVTGNGGSCTSAATCTGGAIQSTTGDGISLTNTRAPSLTRMFISGSGAHCMNATTVNTGMTLASSYVTNCGNADNEYGLNISNLTGTATISGTTFNNAADDLVHFVNNNTNGNITVDSSSSFVYPASISGTANAGIAIQPNGTSNVTVTVQNSTFTNIKSDSIQWGAATAGSNGTSTLNFSNNTITVNTAGRASGFSLSCQESTTGNITVANNNFSGAGGNGVISIDCNDSSLLTGSVSGNVITNPPGIGMFVAVDEAAEARLTINGNTVTNSGGDGIQTVNFGGVGVSELYLALTNNQVNGHSANTGVSFVGGISVTAFEDNSCIELRGNAVTGTPASPTQCGGAPCVDYYIEEVGGTMTFEEVPNTASTTLNAAYVNSTNDAGPVTIFGTIDLTNGAQCPFP